MPEYHFSRASLSPEFFKRTADFIVSVQEPDGSIPGVEGGISDPWNHVEAAMGLSVGGRYKEAKKAYDWLIETQMDNGSWWDAHKGGSVMDGTRIDSNHVAYIATGVWHHFLITREKNFLKRMWPTVEAAVQFVLSLQTDYGEISWAVNEKNDVHEDALKAGCCSIFKSLECAVYIARVLEKETQPWELARNRLGHTIRSRPGRFDRTWESKSRYSMDWFYPVLTGVIIGPAAIVHLNSGWANFVVDRLGCRCVSDEPWVTVAESCELVMSLIGAGNRKEAAELFGWLQKYRETDGSFWTGYVYPRGEFWPEEKTTWTAGAVLLAADALVNATSASRLFTAVSAF
jgi:hypothetical protein